MILLWYFQFDNTKVSQLEALWRHLIFLWMKHECFLADGAILSHVQYSSIKSKCDLVCVMIVRFFIHVTFSFILFGGIWRATCLQFAYESRACGKFPVPQFDVNKPVAGMTLFTEELSEAIRFYRIFLYISSYFVFRRWSAFGDEVPWMFNVSEDVQRQWLSNDKIGDEGPLLWPSYFSFLYIYFRYWHYCKQCSSM